jgi:hypothetical protein
VAASKLLWIALVVTGGVGGDGGRGRGGGKWESGAVVVCKRMCWGRWTTNKATKGGWMITNGDEEERGPVNRIKVADNDDSDKTV